MPPPRDFEVHHLTTTVAEAHRAPFPDEVRRAVWFVEPTDAAIVLGSTQGAGLLDLGAVGRRGLGVVRRPSGGGAVLIEPGESTWFDVWLPADDDLFEVDVTRSADWLGDVLVAALATLGLPARRISAGGPAYTAGRPEWASLVCFGAVAPGEVVVDGRKAVGISQRRTRAGARFQVVVPHRFDPGVHAAVFDLDAGARRGLQAWLADRVATVPVAPAALREAVVRALEER